jgi:hypothetical protein
MHKWEAFEQKKKIEFENIELGVLKNKPVFEFLQISQ